jgi:hypothetical protein
MGLDTSEIFYNQPLKNAGLNSVAVSSKFTNDWVKTELDLTGFFYIDTVVITVNSSSANTVLLDRLDLKTDSYFYNKLAIEEIEYAVSNLSIKASASFGNRIKTVVTELDKLEGKTVIPYDIFSKQ